MGQLNISISDDLHARAKAIAALTGRKLYQLVEDALKAEIERCEADKPERRRKRST